GCGRGDGVGGRVADPHSGHVLAVSEAGGAAPEGAFQPRRRKGLSGGVKWLRPGPQLHLSPPIFGVGRDTAADGRDRLSLHNYAERLFPAAGYWVRLW